MSTVDFLWGLVWLVSGFVLGIFGNHLHYRWFGAKHELKLIRQLDRPRLGATFTTIIVKNSGNQPEHNARVKIRLASAVRKNDNMRPLAITAPFDRFEEINPNVVLRAVHGPFNRLDVEFEVDILLPGEECFAGFLSKNEIDQIYATAITVNASAYYDSRKQSPPVRNIPTTGSLP